PVGQMLTSLGRHPYRPAHTHYLITASGYQKLVTHTFVGDDPYLESDTVFGVKSSLVAPFERVDRATVWRSDFDFVLTPVENRQ
ncbi:6-chlorohydroxyquinol-1,2-dioxygenase, partial [Rhizobium ruizarguesonis]